MSGLKDAPKYSTPNTRPPVRVTLASTIKLPLAEHHNFRSALLNMYGKFGEISKARAILIENPSRRVQNIHSASNSKSASVKVTTSGGAKVVKFRPGLADFTKLAIHVGVVRGAAASTWWAPLRAQCHNVRQPAERIQPWWPA